RATGSSCRPRVPPRPPSLGSCSQPPPGRWRRAHRARVATRQPLPTVRGDLTAWTTGCCVRNVGKIGDMPHSPSGPLHIMAAQPILNITSRSGACVTVYLTLDGACGCVQDVKDIPLVRDRVNPLHGSCPLSNGATKAYVPPQGLGISGTFAFGSPP